MKAAAASELSTVLRQIGRHTGPQTRPDAKQFTDQELKLDQHAMQFFLLLSSTGLAYRRCELARIDDEQIGARFLQAYRADNRRRCGSRAPHGPRALSHPVSCVSNEAS
jgi:hypothetical protein